MSDQVTDNWTNIGLWGKIRILLVLGLLVALSYEMGISHARSEHSAGEYSALRAQYDRIETENSALRDQYDRVLTVYSASKTECSATLTEYAALKAQYERMESQKGKTRRQ